MLAYFFAYLAYVVLAAIGRPELLSFELAMLAFAVPLTVMGIGFSLFQSVRATRGPSGVG